MFPAKQPSRVVVSTNDGSTFEEYLEYPKGDPREPMTMDDLEEIDSNSQFFQLNFVQTATDKQLYYLVGTLFFLLSFFLFISRRKFY